MPWTPDPIFIQLGPIPVYWYGICYAVGLVLVYFILTREARRKGMDANLVGDGMIIIAVAALIGGRLYHVIDQWALYKDDPLKIILPPYTGLGVYGGIITGTLAAAWYIRRKHQSFWAWSDAVAPALFAMQFVGRIGNFFNQELYGPPTDLPWGIPIECQHRIEAYPCAAFPFETTRFQPLFLYESLSGLIGMLVLLWLARRFAERFRPGDLLGIFFIWYGTVRFLLENLRSDNWTFNGIPTAWIFSLGSVVLGAGIILWHHRRTGPTIADEDARRREERDATLGGRVEDDDEVGDDADAPGTVQRETSDPVSSA